MAYVEYPISTELQPFVKVIWSMESEPDETPDFSMRILPDSCVEMVVHYRQPLITTHADGNRQLQPHSFVVAQMKNFIELAPSGRYGFMSIRFSAFGAYHFFQQPMKEIVNHVVDLNHVWKTIAGDMIDKVAIARTGFERSSIIQDYLRLQLSRNSGYDKVVDYSLRELYSSGGKIGMGQLASKTGLSNRQLVRRFDQKVGMSPKEFSNILRFINATRLLRESNKSIYDVAYLSGYYDHAHFFHDFKRFSGLNPGQFQNRPNVFL
ncbi:MAG TPA: helix-turn-helix domain-containing protein [Cyclobacteriaceae bacterium]|nr:helix-turn-helix domain-containing protein [Cyclobacteriaceae bacterium]